VDDVDFAGWTLEKSIQVIQDDRRTRVLIKGRPYKNWPSGDQESVRQLTLNLAAVAQAAWKANGASSEPPSAEGGGSGPGSDAQGSEGDEGRDYRRNYSPAQRVYLDQLEQGDYNAYAGGLLFAPLLARYDFRYLETTRSMSKYGKIRAVVLQSASDQKRAAIYTNATAEEIGAARIVELMCHRWGEENAIKELLLKHLINYTPGYVLEDLEEQPLVTNPQVTDLKKQRAGLVSELNRLKIELAEQVLKQPGDQRKAPRRSQAEVLESIAVAESAIALAD
jgi:hypothetical protein